MAGSRENEAIPLEKGSTLEECGIVGPYSKGGHQGLHAWSFACDEEPICRSVFYVNPEPRDMAASPRGSEHG